ncbi:MAG: hypothetical protein ABS914_15935 [Stenotrophomonas sp.]
MSKHFVNRRTLAIAALASQARQRRASVSGGGSHILGDPSSEWMGYCLYMRCRMWVFRNAMSPMRHGRYLIEQLNTFNLAYLHFVEGATATSRVIPEGVDLDVLRKLFNGPFIGNNNYDLEMAIDRREAGLIDAVALGRLFISNPDLVERLRQGADVAIAPREAYYGGGAKGYIDWPKATN